MRSNSVNSDSQLNLKKEKQIMKLLDVMKKYDRCVVRESAKLTKIYNLLLKESAEADDIDEAEVCPDCGNDPCTCESEDDNVTEADDEVITAEEFFAEAEKAKKEACECDASDNETIDESEDEEKTDESEDEEKTDEAEEMMSAEEFFSESDDNATETDESEDEEKTDESEDEEKTDESEEINDEEKDEKKLEESLKSYRRANHHLFNA